MNGIVFDGVSKIYPQASQPAVEGVSLEVTGGRFVVLLGPSGCGKTTLLKMVNRLYEPSSGTIYLDGVDIRQLEVTELRRQIGYVIQQVGLFPHMTVAQNIAVVPELVHWPRARIEARIDELLELVHLPLEFRTRYPSQLSGGQQQRVGLARALAVDPKVMLMDEPFGAIDAITRSRLQNEMLELQRRLRKTVLFVTHDVDEALYLADEIIVLRQGKVIQYDAPCNLLNAPADDFVRELLNADDRIRQLGLLRVETAMKPLPAGTELSGGPVIGAEESLRQALSLLLQPGVTRIVAMLDGRPVGKLTLDDLRGAGCVADGEGE